MGRFMLALSLCLLVVPYAVGQANKVSNQTTNAEAATPRPTVAATSTAIAEQPTANSASTASSAQPSEPKESKSELGGELLSGIIGAIVGALFGAGASQFLATRHARQQLKFDTLRRFVANRFNVRSPEFSQVINEIVIVYAGSAQVAAALSELLNGSNNTKLLALYRAMCKDAGVKDQNVSDELFLKGFNITNP